MAESLIGIFYGDFYELTLLESQRTSISSTAARMQRKCPRSICLPTKSDLLLSEAARLKLSYPATPCSVLSRHQHTHTCTRTHTQIHQSFRLSFGRSPLVDFFARICSKLSTLQAFYVNIVLHVHANKIKCSAQLQTNSVPLEKKKRKIETLQTELVKSPNSRIETELCCCSHKLKGGT